MSLVGTRPILQDELRQYELHHRRCITVRTGWHQIYPREESPDMLMLDLFLAHLKTMRSCQKNMGLSYRCFELRRDTWNE